MLNQFKQFDTDRMDLDEMVALVAFGEKMRETYEKLNLEEPEWVATNLKSLKREIKAKDADRKAKRLMEVRARLETMKTPGQLKAELEKEKKQLEAELQEA